MPKRKAINRRKRKIYVPKECYFCKVKIEPSFWDIQALQRFLTERGKITPSAKNGICSKHQRSIALNIKYARHLALLPFVARS